MEDPSRGIDGLEAFLQSELAAEVISRGSEMIFAQHVEGFVRALDLDRWEGDPDYVGDQVETFVEAEMAAGRLQAMDPWAEEARGGERQRYGAVMTAISHVSLESLEARYTTEVLQGAREDMRVIGAADREPSSLEPEAARDEAWWRDGEEHAIVHIRFADGGTLNLDAEARETFFLEGGDEDIVSETRFTQVRHERVGQGAEGRLELTGVNAEGQRHVIGGSEDGRVVTETSGERDRPQAAASTLGAHVRDLLRGIADLVRGRDAHGHTHDLER
jgi:hypothetical protein